MEPIMYLDHSVCYNGRKIPEHFARTKMTRTPHPVYFSDLSPSDFWFFGYAKEQLKDQPTTDETGLEGKLADIWEQVH
jgi:hypothetical protein